MSSDKKFSHEDYHRVVEETFAKCVELGKLKGGEYAGDYDRLANFRRNAEQNGCSMELVWKIYAGKHWDAISQFVMDINRGKMRTRMESLEGRCDDIIVYLLLFKCILKEKEQEAANNFVVQPTDTPFTDHVRRGLQITETLAGLKICTCGAWPKGECDNAHDACHNKGEV